MRRHHVEAARLAVSVRPLERLDQGQNSAAPAVRREAEEDWSTLGKRLRRFSPPWTVRKYRDISYIVRDANNFPVAYVYFESGVGVDVQQQIS